jgi:hypothetical protein
MNLTLFKEAVDMLRIQERVLCLARVREQPRVRFSDAGTMHGTKNRPEHGKTTGEPEHD